MKYFYSLFFLFILGCGSKGDSIATEDTEANPKYPDGTYCAEVTYHNPETGTTNTYTLNVEVENNELTEIYWNNGGWLDDSHFNPEQLNDSGQCSFTSDKGYEYEIEIRGSKCSETDKVANNFELTLEQCAETCSMTEEELSQYETDFNVSRFDLITEERCNSLSEYIIKARELRGRMKSLKKAMDEGYIQSVQAVSRYDRITCQNVIVKRYGIYYWLEVSDSRKCTMGLMQFDPSISGWQEVTVTENPSNPVIQIYTMRVMDQSSEKSSLEDKMSSNCTF